MSTELGKWFREETLQKVLLVVIVLVASMLILSSFFGRSLKREYHWTRNGEGRSDLSGPRVAAPSASDLTSRLALVTDPELDIDIVSLGLIDDIAVDGDSVRIIMTLTTPACPYVSNILEDVRKAIFSHQGVESVDLRISLDPPWTIDRVSSEAKARLLAMMGQTGLHDHVHKEAGNE